MTDDDASMNGMNESGTGKTGEAALPGRCPTVGQGGHGCHPAIARMKWSRPVKGQMARCLEEKRFNKDNRACDQARVIRKNEWLTSVKLDEIKRRLTAAEELVGQDAGCIDPKPEQVDEQNGDVNVQITDNDTRNDEERQMIKGILEITRSRQVWNGAGFERMDRKVLTD